MNAEAIQSFCIAGTDAYLSFLLESNRGLERVNVLDVQRVSHLDNNKLDETANPIFKLRLARALFDPESISLELKPPSRLYDPEYFQVVEYDGKEKVLIIQVQNPELVLDGRAANELCVISDLRFLVRNVRRWYASNGAKLQLPCTIPAVCAGPDMETCQEDVVALDACQAEAVSASLGNSLTYVWGPPGTGKTKHMLTKAVLQLLRRQKKIGLLAPTNNALEQAMTAILKAAGQAGIDEDKLLRIGHPSAKFAKCFPKVCEVKGLLSRLGDVRRQIDIYDTVLNHRRGATVLNSAATLLHEIETLKNFLRQRRALCGELGRMRRNLLSKMVHLLDGKLRTLNEELTGLETDIAGQLEVVRRTRTESPPLNAIIERINFTTLEQIEKDVACLQNAVSRYLEVNRSLAEEYTERTTEEIQQRKREQEEEAKALEAQTIQEKIKSASLIGMTLDCLIGRFCETYLPFDHIFLDEAGYAPLVKAMTLCQRGIPLTFIGDHRQLGPVCEMDDESLTAPSNTPAIVWRKSALFLDEMFAAEDENDLIARLCQTSEPRLRSFNLAFLNRTFRFGQKLADILSACAYHDVGLVAAGFHGDLDIVCLNAVPTSDANLRRQNRAEARCIDSYFREHAELIGEDEETYVILAPYNNQVTLLGEIMPDARRQGRIMTVHKSQGREWDTVFLSIVDGRLNSPWFTDTRNPQSGGLYVVNTAVSRARKRLIVVCDRDYWLRPGRDEQLISRLLRVSG